MKVRVESIPTGGPLLRAPVSKSDVHRALVLGDLLKIPVDLGDEAALPNDVRVLAHGLEQLRKATIEEVEIDVEDAGAPFRILLALAATRPNAKTRFVGTARLQERPHSPLLQSLRHALGSEIVPEEVQWPLRVQGRTLQNRTFPIDPTQSSQFVTALLLASAQVLVQQGISSEVQLLRPTASQGYLDITLRWLERAGLHVKHEGMLLRIEKAAPPPALFQVPGDWSSLSYLLMLAWKQKRTLHHLPTDPHPDAQMVKVIDSVGLKLSATKDGHLVTGIPNAGFDQDISLCPDLAPSLAALSLVLPQESWLRRVDILRGKESDRVKGVQAVCETFGGRAELVGEDLRLIPASPTRTAADKKQMAFDPWGDHRLAMAAAVAAILTSSPIVVEQAECVAKSFPKFWEMLGAGPSGSNQPLFG